MPRKIEAVMYDLDNTLIDTTRASSQNLVWALRRYLAIYNEQVRVPTPDEAYAIWAPTWSQWVPKCVPGIDIARFRDFYDSILDEQPFGYAAFNGAVEAVRFTRTIGPQGIMTSRRRDHLAKRLVDAGFDPELFDFVYTDVKKDKDPKSLESGVGYITGRGISREGICYVGDHSVDYEVAVLAGLHFIGVLTGPTADELMMIRRESDHIVLPSVKHLPAYIKLINSK